MRRFDREELGISSCRVFIVLHVIHDWVYAGGASTGRGVPCRCRACNVPPCPKGETACNPCAAGSSRSTSDMPSDCMYYGSKNGVGGGGLGGSAHSHGTVSVEASSESNQPGSIAHTSLTCILIVVCDMSIPPSSANEDDYDDHDSDREDDPRNGAHDGTQPGGWT